MYICDFQFVKPGYKCCIGNCSQTQKQLIEIGMQTYF